MKTNEQRPKPVLLSRSRLPLAIVVIVMLLAISTGITAHIVNRHARTTKTASTTTTHDGKTVVGNAASGDLTVKGVVLDQSLSAGYSQSSAAASEVAAVKQTLSNAGLQNYLTFAGSTTYSTTGQASGDAVIIFWGNTGSSYSNAGFASKYDSYQMKVATSQKLTLTTSKAPSVSVHASNDMSYVIPCETGVTQTGDKVLTYYQITCYGQLKGSNGFISFSTVSASRADGQAALTKFIAGSKIAL